MIKKTFLFRISGIILFIIGMVLRMKKIPGSLPILLVGIGLLMIGYVIWLYGTYTRKKLGPQSDKEIEASDT
tara:strand:- start:4322 stop:4537 length:216 start_codon:yes stop_codon:yes gene_type:complete